MNEEKKLKKVEDKNITWSKNHALIMQAYDELYDENRKVPTLDKVAQRSGLSVNTVHKHAESLTLENVNTKFKLAGERVTKRLIKNIEENGKAPEVKLFNQIVFGYKEGHEHTGKDGKGIFEEIKITFVE